MSQYTSTTQAQTVGTGRYEYARQIGAGGYATVHAGLDRATMQDVAVKIRKPPTGDHKKDAKADEAMRREASISVNHPGLVTALDGGEELGQVYVVSPLVKGQTLLAELSNGFVPSNDEAGSIITQVFAASDALHASGYAHGDLSLNNIMLDRQTGVVYIIDYGSVWDLNCPSSKQIDSYHSTPGIIPPDILDGASQAWGPSQDFFAIGVCGYALITGALPYLGDTPDAVNNAVLNDQRSPIRDLTPHAEPMLVHIVENLLSPDPVRRYDCARDVLAALSNSASNDAATSPPSNTHTGLSRARCSACGAKTKPPVCQHCRATLVSGVALNLWESVTSMHSTYFLAEGEYSFGRKQIDPLDRTVSRHQVVIQVQGARVQLRDGGSCNPTSFQCVRTGNTVEPGSTLISFSRYTGHFINA